MKNFMLPLAASALLLAACGKKEQPAPQPETQAAQTQSSPAAAGYVQKETYFRLPNAAGGEIDLAAYAGKPVLVMFFTETCPYCRKAAPFIQKVHASHGSKGLAVVGICVQDSAQAAKNFAQDFGVTFPLAYKGKEISRNYRTQGVPYIYLLDKGHEVYDVWEGYDPQYDASILKAIETVLAGK
ncbi:MAG: TlpA family protein disulfide reductase [Elusimicrobiales bacterium]